MAITKTITLYINVNEDENLNFLKDLNENILIEDKATAESLKSLVETIKSYDYLINVAFHYAEKELWSKALEVIKNIDDKELFHSKEMKRDILLKAEVLLNCNEFYYLEEFLNKEELKSSDYPELLYYRGRVKETFNFNYLSLKNYISYIERINEADTKYQDNLFNCYLRVADILYKEMDYEKAAVYYENYLIKNKGTLDILTRYALSIFKSLPDNNEAYEKIRKAFNTGDINGLYVTGEILFRCEKYEYALPVLIDGSKIEYSDRFLFRIGEIFMYIHEYDKAKEIFDAIPTTSWYRAEAILNKIIIEMILGNERLEEELLWVEDENLKRAIQIAVLTNEEVKDNLGKVNEENILKWYEKILNQLLKCKEYFIFEKAIKGLNNIDSPFILSSLAKVYMKNNFKELAREEIEKSIEKYGFVKKEEVEILYHYF